MCAVGVGSLNVITCVETEHCLLKSIPEAPFPTTTTKNYQNTKTETCGESSLDVRVSLSLLREGKHGGLKSIKPVIDLSL